VTRRRAAVGRCGVNSDKVRELIKTEKIPCPFCGITELERGIIKKLARATYPPATASKRFVRDLSSGYISQLSEKGRAFLAFVAHRFRRQYELTQEEWIWVHEHKKD